MFYEELDFLKFDIEALREEVKRSVFPLGNQVIQGEEYETPQYQGFGGWSLLSRTGDWQDGFEFYQGADKADIDMKAMKYLNIAHSMEYKKPTQACVGEIKNVLDQITKLGLTPRRARVTCLKAHCKSLVHTDGELTEYIARIHIPLFTNKKCLFISDGTNLHMEAGKAYMVWVNNWHQIRNDSDEDRYHIIMDAYDTQKITQNFQYNGSIEQLEDYAIQFRKTMEETVLDADDLARIESMRQKYVTKGLRQSA
jgi:hypothetical protein